MPPVQYRPVPTMELSELPAGQTLSVPPRRPRTESSTSGSDRGPERLREDRRRGRLNSELLTAIIELHTVEDIEKKLQCGASVDATCRATRTSALQLAVACGHVRAAQLLLSRNADVQARDRAGRQAVHLAATAGSLPLLRALLDRCPSCVNSPVCETQDRPDPDRLDSWSHDHQAVADKIPELSAGATAMHLAAQRLHLDCVSALVSLGGRVDLQDKRGLTPLDVVGELPPSPPHTVMVDLSADALPVGDTTRTRIDNMRRRIAASPSARSIRMNIQDTPNSKPQRSSIRVQGLDNEESDPGLAFRSLAFTPDVTQDPKSPSVAQKVVNELINSGATMARSKVIVRQGEVVNQVKMQMTCLHTAVGRQDSQLIEYLLDHGACQLTWDSSGLTPLHLAVSERLLDPLRVLLEKNKLGQVVDARDIYGRTPLHLAIEQEWCEGVSLLLECGADVKVTDNDNRTVLHVAATKTDSHLLEELLTIPESVKVIDSRNSQHETPLCCAVAAGRLASINLLLARTADITTSLPGDITLLHLAAERGDCTTLGRLLQDTRISVCKNVRSKEGKGGVTPLHIAAIGGFNDCVELLLTSGCNVFEVTTVHPHFGSTALHLAAIQGNLKVVETIIRHNKSALCMKNANGWYPLHVAARFSQKNCVRYMLLNGANLAATVFDSGGYKKTALDIIVYSILHPVHFLEKIFNCCIEVNEFPLNHPKCEINIRYDLLQPLGSHRKQLKVLDSLLNCGKDIVQEKLLLHPLVETFLHLKWRRLWWFFFLMMALYLVFTVSLTAMAMVFYVIKANDSLINACVSTCRFTLCVSLALITFQELLQFARMQRYYLTDLESWVKWATFSLSTVVALSSHPAPGVPSNGLIHVTAVAVLLSWLELLFLFSRWPSSIGFYILMFFTVAKNVIRVLATFTFVILGFTFAFMIHFEAEGPFGNLWEAFVKVMAMTSEFEYSNIFENISGVSPKSVVSRTIFLSFMMLISIVLMNLLVGLAVSDIATLEKQGRAQRLAKQIEFLSLLEMFVYNRRLFACCPTKLTESLTRCRAIEHSLLIEPGKPLRKTTNPLGQELRQTVITSIINRGKESEEDSCDDLGEDNVVEKQSTSTLSTKIEEQKYSEKNKPTDDTDLKSNLESIMKELASIKQELGSLRLENAARGRNGAVP